MFENVCNNLSIFKKQSIKQLRSFLIICNLKRWNFKNKYFSTKNICNMKTQVAIFVCFVIGITIAEDILTSPIVTNWGEWGTFQDCPAGTKVIAFQLKTERWDAWDALIDDTCLNGVKFYCGYPAKSGPGQPVDIIQSIEGNWGKWGNIFWCDGLGFARGFMMRSKEADTARVDETAANNLRILCSEGTQFIEGDGERWGEWTTPRICRADQYICGLQTQVEPPRGLTTDDTALNNIRVKCCDLTMEEILSYGLNVTRKE